jgi:PAS domain S-box-containing protein
MRGLLFLLLVVATAPLVALVVTLHIDGYYSRFADSEAANLDVGRAIAVAFGEYVRDVTRQEAAIGSALTGPQAPRAGEASRYLAANVALLQAISGFHWTNPQGEVIASSDARGFGLKIGGTPWFQAVLGGANMAVSDLIQDPATGKLTFVIARGTRDEKDVLAGVAFAVIDASRLGLLSLNVEQETGGTFALFDRQGTVVYTNPERTLSLEDRRWLDKDPMIGVALAGQETSGTFIFPPTGEKRIGGRVPLREFGWAVGTSRPITDVSAPLFRTLLIDLGVMGAVVAGSALLSGLIARRITRPAMRLREEALAIGAGNLDRRVDVQGVTELAELGDAFNLMAAGLKAAREDREKAQTALQDANAHLEQRVRERTAQVRQASLYARSLIEASLDPLVTISPAGKVTDVNRATELATGLTRDQLIGTDFSDYFTEPQRAREGYQKVIAEGEVRDYPLTLRHASGRTIDVLYNATVYRNEAGEIQGVFAAARDITERKRTEQELGQYRQHLEDLVRQRTAELETSNRQLQEEIAERKRVAEDLARSNKDLEQFAYVASHDLQEPLRIVSGYLQLIERRYKGKLAAEADEFINFAVDGAARMQSLIQDLLAYSRVGTQGRRFASTDCEKVFERAVGNLGRAIADSGATVAHDPLPTVLADATQLVQVFQNLIGNAIKFRGAEPPRIHVAARPQDGQWLFSVRDNGIGVEPQYAERIFVLFQRLHPRDKYPGTGIGLSVCQRIIERHGGRIWVESKPGEGSTFHFTLGQARSDNSATGMGKL